MPAPDHQVPDPRVKRTRKLLQDGLRQVLHQKPLEEVSVQDIADAATVNRATFYDHYGDKFDLFNALIAADFQKLLEQRQICLGECAESGLTSIVMAVGDFLQQMHGDQAACSQQQASSGPLVDAALTLAVRRIFVDGLKKHAGGSPAEREVLASLVSGAIYSAVKQSLSQSGWRADGTALRSVARIVLPLLRSKTNSRTTGPAKRK